MTTVAVSAETLALLNALKKQFNAGNMDEFIRMLVAKAMTKEDLFGCDKGRIDTKGLRDEDDRSI